MNGFYINPLNRILKVQIRENMKKILPIILLCFITKLAIAQDDKQKVERACLNYIEGFYEGDTTKLIASLKPTLYKIGFWKNEQSDKYEFSGQMTYRKALDYAKGVQEKKNFPKADAPKKVEVIDVMNAIAVAKVSAWWGFDYLLLSKLDDKWMIEEVIWEGPPQK